MPLHSHSQTQSKNIDSQETSAARTKFCPFHSHSHSLENSFATLHSQGYFDSPGHCIRRLFWVRIQKNSHEDLVAKLRKRILRARRNSHAHSQPHRCDRSALSSGKVSLSNFWQAAKLQRHQPKIKLLDASRATIRQGVDTTRETLGVNRLMGKRPAHGNRSNPILTKCLRINAF